MPGHRIGRSSNQIDRIRGMINKSGDRIALSQFSKARNATVLVSFCSAAAFGKWEASCAPFNHLNHSPFSIDLPPCNPPLPRILAHTPGESQSITLIQ